MGVNCVRACQLFSGPTEGKTGMNQDSLTGDGLLDAPIDRVIQALTSKILCSYLPPDS